MSRAVGYARVSTKRQAMGSGLPRQVDCIRSYCEERGYDLISIVEEVGSAYHPGQQPLLAKALNLLDTDQADVLVVEASDRLSRRGAAYYFSHLAPYRIEYADLHERAFREELASLINYYAEGR